MASSNPTSPTVPVVVTAVPAVDLAVSHSPTPSDRSTPPPEVHTDQPSGVERGALLLAKQFMAKMGNLARKCRTRGQLSELYLTTFKAWADAEIQADSSQERHFKQVLFAIAHGMKLVRVRDQGRTLFWNRYRDNNGEPIEEERAKFHERRQQRPRDYDDRPRHYDDRRPRHYDDRRPRHNDDRRPRDYDDRRPRDYDDRSPHSGRSRPHDRQFRPDSRGWTRVGGNTNRHRGRD